MNVKPKALNLHETLMLNISYIKFWGCFKQFLNILNDDFFHRKKNKDLLPAPQTLWNSSISDEAKMTP